MKMFDEGEEQMGLFTFYRQQAEKQKQIELAKSELRRKNKEKREAIQQQRLIQEKQKLNKIQNMVKREKGPQPKIDFGKRAKQYIKDVEMFGGHSPSRIYSFNSNQNRRSGEINPKMLKYHSMNMERDGAKSSFNDFFRSKKDGIQPYYYDRVPICPKDFGSLEQLLEQSKKKVEQQAKKLSKINSLAVKRKVKYLPKINSQTEKVENQQNKNDDDYRNMRSSYDHKNILENNQKYSLVKDSTIRKKPKSLLTQSKTYQVSKMGSKQRTEADNALMQLLKRYPALQ